MTLRSLLLTLVLLSPTISSADIIVDTTDNLDGTYTFALSGASTVTSGSQRFDINVSALDQIWSGLGPVFDQNSQLDGLLTANTGTITTNAGVLTIDEIVFGASNGGFFGFETSAVDLLTIGEVITVAGAFTYDAGGTEDFSESFTSSEHGGLALQFNGAPAAVPEPGTTAFLSVLGAVGFFGARRRKKKASVAA